MTELKTLDLRMPLLTLVANTMPNDRPEWFAQCLDSFSKVNDPRATLMVLPGVPGNINQARINSLQQVISPYWALLDPDDFLVPETLPLVLDMLELHRELGLLFTDEYTTLVRYDGSTVYSDKELGDIVCVGDSRVLPSNSSIARNPGWTDQQKLDALLNRPEEAHHLAVWNTAECRRHVEFVRNTDVLVDWALTCLCATSQYGFRHLPMYSYVWRLHSGGVHKNIKPGLVNTSRALISQYLSRLGRL